MLLKLIIFLNLIFIGCSSNKIEQSLDLKDCNITVPFEYEIKKVNTNKITLVPNDIRDPLYFVSFENNLDRENSTFRKFLNSYSPTKFFRRQHLKIVEGVDSHMKAKVYFVIGDNFYIVYTHRNETIDKIISECNENWVK